RAAVVTKVGRDGFGDSVRAALAGFGVDTRWVGTDAKLRTPIVFCEIFPPDNFPVLFYREPKAPDMNITRDELDLGAIAAAPVFWTSGTGLSDEPSRTATLAALDARTRRDFTIHDLDYRHHLWPNVEDARRWTGHAVRRASIVVGNVEEVEMATGLRDAKSAAAALLQLGATLAVVKRGHEGVYARGARDEVSVPPVEIEVMNGLGAGDAFGGALCHGLLSGWPLARPRQAANAAGGVRADARSPADLRVHELDRPRRHEHDHRGGARDREPASGVAFAGRHLRVASARASPPAARVPLARRRLGERRVPARVALLGPD